MRTTTVFTIAGVASSAMAGYTLKEDFMSGNFFDHFDFFNSPDPTHGFVNYVDSNTANAQGYVNTQKGVYIGVDSKNVASSAGRDSVRITSKSSTTEGLIILDLAHMPGGIAGTWPAFWTVGPDWPNNGEVDIIEGVNNQNTNFMTIHSGNQACQISSNGAAALNAFTTNCWNQFDGNVGCSFHDNNQNSYGAGFNQQGGGVFAMEHAGSVISVWFFGRNEDLSQVLSDNPDPKSWPAPRAQWLSTSNQFGSCDLSTAVQQQSIVFDTTFCGDWAGAAYPGGQSACQQFVQNTPSAFEEAYWQVNSLRTFTTDGQPVPASSSVSVAAPSSTPVPDSTSAAMPSASASTISTLMASSAAPSSTVPSAAPSTSAAATSASSSESSSSAAAAASTTSSLLSSSSNIPSFSTTPPALPTTTTTSELSPTVSASSEHHHHHSKHRHESSTTTAIQAVTTLTAASTTQIPISTTIYAQPSSTDVPEMVIDGPDGIAYEIPANEGNTKRSISARKHGRQFVNFGA